MPIFAAAALPFTMTAIGAGATAGAGIYGAHEQAGATEDAAKIQNDYNMKALADAQQQREWQRQQYADYLTRTQPFRDAGAQAGTSLSAILARGPNIPSQQQLALPASSVGNLAAK